MESAPIDYRSPDAAQPGVPPRIPLAVDVICWVFVSILWLAGTGMMFAWLTSGLRSEHFNNDNAAGAAANSLAEVVALLEFLAGLAAICAGVLARIYVERRR